MPAQVFLCEGLKNAWVSPHGSDILLDTRAYACRWKTYPRGLRDTELGLESGRRVNHFPIKVG